MQSYIIQQTNQLWLWRQFGGDALKFSLAKLLPYECLKARHSCKAQGVMRAKPEMKPWVNRGHKN